MLVGAVFPGQGSQAPGMGKSYFDNFQIAKDTYHEASEVLNFDLGKMCFEGSSEELALTQNTQPALLATSTAIFRVLEKELGFKPKMAAGHSIGEYAALVAANVLDFKTAVRAVRLRGQAMQDAVPVGLGGMVAVIGLEDAQVNEVCQWAEKESGSTPLVPANFNCPGQVVISGNKKTIDWLLKNWDPSKFAGFPTRVKMMPLNVSAPFHCSMMMPAEQKMSQFFETVEFRAPYFPIVQNVSAEPESEPTLIKKQIVTQVSAPVRWTECVQAMNRNGITQLVEIGHGKVISGLVKKITPETMTTHVTQEVTDLDNLRPLLKALGQ